MVIAVWPVVSETVGRKIYRHSTALKMCHWLVSDRKPPARPLCTIGEGEVPIKAFLEMMAWLTACDGSHNFAFLVHALRLNGIED